MSQKGTWSGLYKVETANAKKRLTGMSPKSSTSSSSLDGVDGDDGLEERSIIIAEGHA